MGFRLGLVSGVALLVVGLILLAVGGGGDALLAVIGGVVATGGSLLLLRYLRFIRQRLGIMQIADRFGRRLHALAGVAAGSTLVLVVAVIWTTRAVGGSLPDGPLPTPDDVAALSHVVGQYAHANGESAPRNGQLVVATMGTATTKLLGYEDPDDAQPLSDPTDPVFVVRVSGDFIRNKMPHPLRFVPPPHGRYMYFVFEAQTRELRVLAISNRDEELSQVGTPQPFRPAALGPRGQ